MAERLRARFGESVHVISGDATATGLTSATFSSVACFTMLHHLPDAQAQDRLFAEAFRLLRPGGLFLGTDGLDSADLQSLHTDDVYVPVSPVTLPGRLQRVGFADIAVDVGPDRLRFRCRRPAATSDG